MNFEKLNLKSKNYINDLCEEEIKQIIDTYKCKSKALQDFYNKAYLEGSAQAYFDFGIMLNDMSNNQFEISKKLEVGNDRIN